mgnify:CR=1 FL=1
MTAPLLNVSVLTSAGPAAGGVQPTGQDPAAAFETMMAAFMGQLTAADPAPAPAAPAEAGLATAQTAGEMVEGEVVAEAPEAAADRAAFLQGEEGAEPLPAEGETPPAAETAELSAPPQPGKPDPAPVRPQTRAAAQPAAPQAQAQTQAAALSADADAAAPAPLAAPETAPAQTAAAPSAQAASGATAAAAPQATAQAAAQAGEAAQAPPREKAEAKTERKGAGRVEAFAANGAGPASPPLGARAAQPAADMAKPGLDRPAEAPLPETAAAAEAPAAEFDAPDAGGPAEAAPSQASASTAASAGPAAAQARGSPETVANLSAQILKKLDARSTRFDVELTPEGLGKVDVRVEIGAGGRMTAAMSFDTPQAAQELRARAGELQRALELAGFDVSGGMSFDVAGDQGRPSQGFLGQDGRDAGAAFRGRAFRAALDTAGEADAAPARGGLNLRRGVTAGLDVRI